MMCSRYCLALSLTVSWAACASQSQPDPIHSIDPPDVVSAGILSVQECDHPPASDSYTIGNVTADGDQLVARVQFGGGCERHDFAVCWNHAVADSFPPLVGLALTHNAHDDSCDAWFEVELRINIASVLAETGTPVKISLTGASARVAGTTSSVLVSE